MILAIYKEIFLSREENGCDKKKNCMCVVASSPKHKILDICAETLIIIYI